MFDLRFSGNEPSLQWDHVVEVINAVSKLVIFR